MFSVVIPTIWSPNIESIDSIIENLSQIPIISEIIIINNKPQIYSDRYSNNSKVKELKYDNIYVNQSWNVGVSKSTNESICLMNDDIQFNTDVFNYINVQLNSENIKIIGVSKSSYYKDSDTEFYLEKISIRNRGWGCLIFVKKSFYTQIPDDLKIHFGDDYLIKQLEGYVWRLEGLKITSEISTSVNSDPEFHKIIEEDNINSLKYGLPWSSDY
jgi:hypothetical protein